jgi:hypothetical protein
LAGFPNRFSKKEASVLQLIIEENLSNFIFDGIKRKAGMHQETLSRALAELEDAGVITKTNQGYRVADNDEMFGGAGEDFLEGRDGE